MNNKNNNLIVTIVIVVIVGALAFYGGMQYEKSKSATLASGATAGQFGQGGFQRGQGGAGGAGGRRGGGNATMGQIVSIDASSMTVKMQDGSSKIVDLSSKTTFNKTSTATQADFKVGDTITAFGTANSDGSVTAMMVSSGNNVFRGARGGTGGGAAPSGQPAK